MTVDPGEPGPPIELQVWRILSPRWMNAPLSGAGAARFGGRWNRPGQGALYVSEQVETAFAEYQQEAGVRPGLFVAYRATLTRLTDLTASEVLSGLGAERDQLFAPWKTEALRFGETPPTWRLADHLRQAADVIRVPSVRYAGGTSLVFWRWNEAGAPSLQVLDPQGELPTG